MGYPVKKKFVPYTHIQVSRILAIGGSAQLVFRPRRQITNEWAWEVTWTGSLMRR